MTTSPGFTAVPEGMFSVLGIRPTTWTLGFSRPSISKVPSTAAAPDMSYFMSSMFWAGLIEMPPVSKVTPLPISTTGAASEPLYSMRDEARLLGAALRHRQEGAHLFLDDGGLVEDGDPEAVALGQLAGDVGHVGRGGDVAREHLEPAGKRLPRPDRFTHPVALSQLGGAVVGEHLESLEWRFLILPRLLHLIVLPGALVETLGDRLAGLGRAHLAPSFGREMECRAGHSEGAGTLGCDGRGAADGGSVYLVLLAEPDQQYSRHGPGRIEHGRVVLLGGEVAGGEQSADGATGLFIESGEGGWQGPSGECERKQWGLVPGRGGLDDGGLERHRGR